MHDRCSGEKIYFHGYTFNSVQTYCGQGPGPGRLFQTVGFFFHPESVRGEKFCLAFFPSAGLDGSTESGGLPTAMGARRYF